MEISLLGIIAQIISGVCDGIILLRWMIPYLTKVLPMQPALQRFVDQLENERKKEKAIAILTKSLKKNIECIDYLVDILKDSNNELQKDRIYKILSKASKGEMVKVVMSKIKQIIENNKGKLNIQIACFNILGSIEGIDAIKILTNYVNCGEWRLSASAIENLGKIGSEIPLENLLLIPQTSSQHQVLKALSSTLGSIRSRTALPYLYNLLNHKIPSNREDAAKAIGDIEESTGSKESLDILKKRMEYENDSMVAGAIAKAMEKINRNNGLEFLQKTSEYLHNNNKIPLAQEFNNNYSLLYTKLNYRGEFFA